MAIDDVGYVRAHTVLAMNDEDVFLTLHRLRLTLSEALAVALVGVGVWVATNHAALLVTVGVALTGAVVGSFELYRAVRRRSVPR